MIRKHDLTKDGMLSFEEFKAIFIEREEADQEPEAPFGDEGPIVRGE